MAKAAEAEAVDSGQQVVIGWFGLCLLAFATFAAGLAARYAKQAVTAGNETVIAAKEATVATERGMVLQNRAYLFVKGFGTEFVDRSDDPAVKFFFNIVPVWENSGNTPALHCDTTTTMLVVTGPMLGSLEFLIPVLCSDMDVTVSPGATFKGISIQIDAAQYTRIWSGEQRMFMLCVLEYDDFYQGSGPGSGRHSETVAFEFTMLSAPQRIHEVVEAKQDFYSQVPFGRYTIKTTNIQPQRKI